MPRKILIVDDSVVNRKLLVHSLQSDYDIMEAENGKEALALMHRNFKILSAVLLDIVMPEMDGYEVLRAVRDNILLAQIPVIMVTASGDDEARVKALSLGANDFILKPFNPDIVRHCLRNNITLRETASILNAIQKDKLTGLFNREAFFEKVNSAIRDRESGFYILSCFDIDNFKLINDQYGAAKGDSLLREIGVAVKAAMERAQGIAGRISADNFAALFPASRKNADTLQNVQERLLSILDKQPIVFSVGRYLVTDLSLPASAIYDRAYIAKQSVKGRFDKHMAYFDETMLEELVRDQQITSEMEWALAGRQFEVWFQPQYNHVTGALIGAEALARWRHPQKGLVPPGEFIPLFEQNGFVYELDKYVWREVCRHLRKWLDDGYTPLPISVNISRYDIFRADLVETITGLVREFSVPIDLIHLEITESAFARSTRSIVEIVKQFIRLGFTIEIDDFGSGYSSLNTLKSVPAQVVKLDMHFLEDDGDETQRGGNILESIVRMTKWLGMSVIAEGVETREQGDFLKSIGCSHVQGYLYAKPMPASEFEALFRRAPRETQLQPLETAEHLDNDLFWNPTSIDTLIFNNYVGAACIYEYHDGAIELLRATDKFARMLGGENATVDDAMQLNLMAHLDKETGAALMRQVAESMRGKEEFTGEFLFLDLPGRPHETYLRSNMRVVASIGDRYLIYCINENITAQRMSETKERRATRRMQAVLDSLNCGITAVTQQDGRTVYLLANDTFHTLLGYTRAQYEQEISDDALRVIFPEDRQRVRDVMRRADKTGAPASMEYRVVRRDGTVVWLRSFVSMAEFEDVPGRVQLCTYADVTSEKFAAQELLDNLPGGAALYAYDGAALSAVHLNKRYWALVARSPVDCKDLDVLSAVHPDDAASVTREINAAIRQGGDVTCDIRLRHGAEGYRPFHIVGRIIPKSDGKYAIYASYTPISDTAMAIRDMLPIALAAVMASSSDLSFVKDRELRYICCSRAFAHMVGLASEKDVAGKTDYDLFDADFAARYVADDRRLMDSGESIIDMVERIPSGDGRVCFSSTSKYLLYDAAGNVAGLYGTGRDITREREAESRQQFLLNSIPGGVAVYEGVWSTLKSIRLTYFSDGFCRLFGYTRAEYDTLGKKNATGLIVGEHIPGLVAQIKTLVADGTPLDFIYKALGKGGAPRWIHIKAVQGERRGDNMTVYALLFDVTERQDALEKLRVSEEENRLAIQHSGNAVCRYDVAAKTLRMSPGTNPIFDMADVVQNVPEGEVSSGRISAETADAYTALYDSIRRGEKSASAVYQRRSRLGWRWIEARSSTIFSGDGRPVSAVLSFTDATESYEKDAAYRKWIQSIKNKAADSYSLFRCNVSKKTVFDTAEGALLRVQFAPDTSDMDEHATQYVAQCVFAEDAERFRAFLRADALLEKYYRGERTVTLEYRECLSQDELRWLRLTVDLVEYPHSDDVEAYLLFEDIDEAKRAALLTMERAETDPLTGVLNRATFAERMDARIREAGPGARHALMMLDVDGFKLVNDAFGHAAGDQTLIDIAGLLRGALRHDDLVGRLGGDEFVMFLNDIPDEKVAAGRARQVCALTRKAFSAEVRISGSVGIALCPVNGADFESLYKKADATLYHVKGTGRDNFAFYNEDMAEEHPPRAPVTAETLARAGGDAKRRMLIVDDDQLDSRLLANLFSADFLIEKARDGKTALIRLRHYGSAISVVLLDLVMPGMDGFAVLEKMRQSAEMRAVPVVVVSGDDSHETSLRAIRAGASDFVMKPVDAEVLRLRVYSAISKADNERLRAKNSFLALQNDEAQRYKTVLDRLGVTVAELDWSTGVFTYSPSMPECLAGRYDDRTLWHILLSDMVADAETVRVMQQLVYDVADDRSRADGGITVRMRAASGEKRPFRMRAYKLFNEYGLTDKMLLTFVKAKGSI